MTEEETLVPEEQPESAPEEPAESLPSRQVWANRFRYFLVGVTIVCIVGAGYLILTRGVSSPADRISVATYTPTYTPTETLTPTPSNTPRPPTQTPTPGPTHTPLPPSQHQVGPDDTWLGLAVYYDVSLDSLLELNRVADSDYIQAGVNVLIPAPTYTPTPNATELPTAEWLAGIECREHVVAAGETLFAIAYQYEMTTNFIQTVNKITDPDLVKEGQKLCIPLATPGPPPSPTFGPSPTPEVKLIHAAPQLLFPPAGVEVPPQPDQVTLQWTVVDFLDPDEYYMIEIRNPSRPDTRAVRGYARTTTWTLPPTVRPAVGVIETFAWRVSMVRGQGEPTEESFRWERSGLPSSWQSFMWMGVDPVSLSTPRP